MIQYKFDPDYETIEIYIDGVELVCWSCEDRNALKSIITNFVAIYNLGAKSGGEITAQDITPMD